MQVMGNRGCPADGPTPMWLQANRWSVLRTAFTGGDGGGGDWDTWPVRWDRCRLQSSVTLQQSAGSLGRVYRRVGVSQGEHSGKRERGPRQKPEPRTWLRNEERRETSDERSWVVGKSRCCVCLRESVVGGRPCGQLCAATGHPRRVTLEILPPNCFVQDHPWKQKTGC